jgi:uncharacterized membrane protein
MTTGGAYMPKPDKNELIKSILDGDGILSDEKELVDLLIKEKVSRNVNKLHKSQLTPGNKMADKMAKFVGSWGFVIIFIAMMALWIVFNQLAGDAFDPYPFILLNLALSCIAAVQAPIIMMSQNRQEEKDRLRARNDYKVNIKSEIIVEDLHKKLDMLIENQKSILERIGKV